MGAGGWEEGVRTWLLGHCFLQVWDINATPCQHESQSGPLPLEPKRLLPTPCFSPLQVVKHLPKAHILACAPSNSGADLLCQRLRVHLPSSIYRLLAPSRDIRMVPEDIKVPGDVCQAEGRQVLVMAQGGCWGQEMRLPGF